MPLLVQMASRSGPLDQHDHTRLCACVVSCSHWLPCTHLSQVTSLELRGPVTDQSLGQLPTQFPCLKRLTVDSSYFARCVHAFVLLA